MVSQSWRMGDRVVLTKRPEWGAGEVISTKATTFEGKPCQSLSIRFERAGLKTLSTAVAQLEQAARSTSRPSNPEPSIPSFDSDEIPIEQKLRTLPEPATDPFRPLANRLKDTCQLYRFSDAPASLFDWAAAQTGLTDPLTQFNRHELEEAFSRFRRLLDEHLRELVRVMRQEDPAALAPILAEAPTDAQRAAQRVQR